MPFVCESYRGFYLEGVYNGVAPNPITNKTMTKIIAAACRSRSFLPAVPRFLLKKGLGSAASILLDSYRVSSDRVKQSDFKFEFEDFKAGVKACLENDTHPLSS